MRANAPPLRNPPAPAPAPAPPAAEIDRAGFRECAARLRALADALESPDSRISDIVMAAHACGLRVAFGFQVGECAPFPWQGPAR